MIRRISFIGWLAACVAFASAPAAVAQKTASPEGEGVLRQLIAANDRQLEAALARPEPESPVGFGVRGSGALIMTMAAAHSSQASKFHHDARLVAAMQKQVKRLRDTQNPS